MLCLLLLAVWGLPAASAGQTVVPLQLRLLAARAETPQGWRSLRRYARSTRNREARGLAYFLLGYREYRANLFGPARSDLHLAVESNCRLADLAEYYEAVDDQQLARTPDGIQAAEDLLERYPQSPVRLEASALLANFFVQAHEAKQAIELLKRTAGAERDPASLLAEAQAYQAEHNARQAATAYEGVYYGFPLSPFAYAAEAALDGMRLNSGVAYPLGPDDRETARADRIFDGSEYERALKIYEGLLARRPHSSLADQWELSRARCLLRLGHYDQAAESLLDVMPGNDPADAERLGLLVHIYERADDEPSMLGALYELYQRYPCSVSYADALFFAGNYFSRHGYWQTAAPYYQRLAESFSSSQWAPQAAWWVAWYKVLVAKNDEAASGLESYVEKFPNSFHVPAALYWLGRIKQEQGFTIQSRSIYQALVRRFPDSYYGIKVRRQPENDFYPAKLDWPSPMVTHGPPGVILARLNPALLPMLPPIRHFSDSKNVEKALKPAFTLAQLRLRDIVDQVVPQAIQGFPATPGLFFALARLRSEADEPALALVAARMAVPNYQDYSFRGLPCEEWKLLYPIRYWTTVRAYARLDGLDPYLVMGLIRQESAFDPNATSVADARGLMQIRPGTAATRIRGRWRRRRIAQLLYSPRYNIRVSLRYLKGLFRTFGNDPGEAIAAYNAGDMRVKEWLANGKFRDSDEFVESIPFADTKAYVESVIRDAGIYRSILTGTAGFAPAPRQEN